MSVINIVSSSDLVEDLKTLWDAQVHQEFVDENICANGCGPMDTVDNSTHSCPKCGFVNVRMPVFVR